MSMVLWVVALSAPAIFVWRTWGLLRLNLKVGTNDDGLARRIFIELLNEAENAMWICDDGNDFPESIYNATEIIQAIRARLVSNEGLHLYCLFSSNDKTSFTEAFANHPRVHMQRGIQPRRDVHFKIIDGGRKGYVSAHPLGSSERRYRSYDCSKVSPHIRREALGRHLEGVETFFQQESALA